ncbi:MAG: hypothetical protein L6Q54_11550 [Leptospiraceae bacterium]|nr:hypothetical protein [Leptospiraceae bacterium]
MAKINFYNIDCIEFMKTKPDKHYDLAIVDPPYGINFAKTHTGKGWTVRESKDWDKEIPPPEYWEQLFRVSKNQIVWGGNFLGLCGGVIVWQKNGTAFGEAEVAICSTHKSVRVFEYTWNGMLQQNMKDKEIRIHPTQKPVALYEWILKNYAKEGDVILDTHLGSGSSRIACHKAGLDFVGCEIDKDYFDKQDARFKNFIAQMTLW